MSSANDNKAASRVPIPRPREGSGSGVPEPGASHAESTVEMATAVIRTDSERLAQGSGPLAQGSDPKEAPIPASPLRRRPSGPPVGLPPRAAAAPPSTAPSSAAPPSAAPSSAAVLSAAVSSAVDVTADDDDEQATWTGEAFIPQAAAISELPAPAPSAPASQSIAARVSLPSFLDDDLSVGDSFTNDLSEQAPDSHVGTVLGDRYVIDRLLGEGGMGKVYRAHHKVIDKKVAVKILHAELAKDKESVGRFLREARAASSIGNPHIVDIIDFGEADDGSTYFVMEYLNGQSLGDVLEELVKISPLTTVDLAIQLCDGLAAAHSEGIVHRDLKPDNIILVKPKGTWAGQGHFVKILDFGIAKVTGSGNNTSKLTMAGAVFGTPHYMSPEQAAGEAVDHRTDIYSLGIMLYEMLAGEMPFQAENFMGILTQHMYKPPPSLRARPEGLECPEALESIVLKCMAKRPEARYQTMEELASDLLTFKKTGAARASLGSAASYAEPAGTVVSQTLPQNRPSTTGASKRVGVIISVTALLLGVAATVVFLGSKTSATTAVVLPATSAAIATAKATAAATTVPAVATQPIERPVLIYSDVAGAFVLRGDVKLKLPETFKVPEGKPLTLRVEGGPGYEATEVTIDGSNAKVKADPKKKFGPFIGKLPKRPNTDGVVDPW